MMSKGYRLSTLKMSISGKNRVFIILCNGKNGSKQILDERNNLFRLVSEIKTDIDGNLIVTAGFINLYGLPTKVYSKMKKKAGLD